MRRNSSKIRSLRESLGRPTRSLREIVSSFLLVPCTTVLFRFECPFKIILDETRGAPTVIFLVDQLSETAKGGKGEKWRKASIRSVGQMKPAA